MLAEETAGQHLGASADNGRRQQWGPRAKLGLPASA